MASVVVVLRIWLTQLLFISTLVLSDNIKDFIWVRNSYFDDVTITDDVIESISDVRNKLNCGMECSKNAACKSFTYNSFSGVCRLHFTVFDATAKHFTSMGSVHYKLNLSTTDNNLSSNRGRHTLTCPPADNYIWLEHAKLCFKINGTHKTWHDARDLCSQSGSRLIVLDTKEKNDAIEDYLKQVNDDLFYYIGLSDEGTEGVFVWTNGQTVDFVYWTKGRENTDDQDCVVLHGTKRTWSTDKCNSYHRFICEKEI